MRDHAWLNKQLHFLLKNYFVDVPITNPLEIRFGREAKFRFGSIRLVKPTAAHQGSALRRFWQGSALKNLKNPQKSIITVTSMFAAESVPVDVVRYTIAHELCHYAHGFSSANKRLFKYPHHGGVVNQELKERGAGDLRREFKKWLRTYRKKILAGRVEI